MVFCQTGGGAGSRMVVKCQTAILEKYFFSMSNHSRTPKTCFTLGLKLFEYISSFKKGGGSEGGLAKDHTFSGFSFVQPSLTYSVFSSSEWM